LGCGAGPISTSASSKAGRVSCLRAMIRFSKFIRAHSRRRRRPISSRKCKLSAGPIC
jgi:hypothetical protein